jgi:hypothetical protein
MSADQFKMKMKNKLDVLPESLQREQTPQVSKQERAMTVGMSVKE